AGGAAGGVVCGGGGRGHGRGAPGRVGPSPANRPTPPGVGGLGAGGGGGAVRERAQEAPPGDLPHLARADEILREVQAAGQVYRSALTRAGWEQRLERLAAGLSAALAGREPGRPPAPAAVAEGTGPAQAALAPCSPSRPRPQ